MNERNRPFSHLFAPIGKTGPGKPLEDYGIEDTVLQTHDWKFVTEAPDNTESQVVGGEEKLFL